MNDELLQRLRGKIATYKPSSQTIELVRQTSVMFLVGAAGAGKDAIKHELLKTGDYHDIVSHTTRSPRVNHGVLEQEGRDYHFIDLVTAEKMIDTQAFVEIKIYSNNIYGTSVAEVQIAHDERKTAITDIEVQGVAEYKAIDPDILAVFVLPPSFEVWQKRLQKRHGETMETDDYARRMMTAAEELNQFLTTDYYTGILNDSLDEAVRQVKGLVQHKPRDESQTQLVKQTAERLRADILQHLAQL